jgi:hypothetical protein
MTGMSDQVMIEALREELDRRGHHGELVILRDEAPTWWDLSSGRGKSNLTDVIRAQLDRLIQEGRQ